MHIRDRIKDFRRIRASLLRPNPRNWRTHPEKQRDALRGVLAEVGYADALLARELPDGSLELIDGHLRAETTPDADVPVLVLDLDQTEADKLLAVLDPLAGMAETNQPALESLLADVEIESQAVRAMLDGMLEKFDQNETDPPAATDAELDESYQVVVRCRDEDQQRELYERLSAEGFSCKLLML
jgi:ParB-like chromosome segregation protein Spo0J